jgi:predicted acyltransferase
MQAAFSLSIESIMMTQRQRFYALDVMRGLAIALMILVNTPGSWQYIYAPLRHAAWHGFTFADIVFPAFLFVVGAAMAFSLTTSGYSVALVQKILRRSALMFGCGLFLNWFWWHDLETLRVMGVLQRIAIAYAIAALLIVGLPCRWLLPTMCVVLLSYFALLQLAADPYSLQGNLVRQIDLWLLGDAHMYQGFGVPFEPEGLLSTMPAVVNVLIGYWVAVQLIQRKPSAALSWLAWRGAAMIGLALLLAPIWPVNKALWSGSYVLLSSGLLLWLLAALVWLVDIKHATRLTEPLRIYGTNPLFIYMLSWMWTVLIERLIQLPSYLSPSRQTDAALHSHSTQSHGDSTLSLGSYLFEHLATVLPAELASLCYAVVHVVLFWWLSRWLYQRQIFIKL